MSEKHFGALGVSFQQKLIKAIIEDKKFGETIIDVLESRFFENNSFRYIVENMKELHVLYNKIPNYDTLGQKIISEETQKGSNRQHIDTLDIIKTIEKDDEYVKDTALNFCKQQNLKKELKFVQNIIDNGEFESFNKIEKMIQNALQVGILDDTTTDVFQNIEEALEKDYRLPIPTGIVGIDNLLKGGLGIGELGVVLAPTGTGKAQPLTSKVLTPNGWKLMDSIQVGDNVISSNGKSTKVIGVYPQDGLRDVYIVKFNDGSIVECDIEHLWSVNTRNMRERKTRKNGKNVYTPNYGFITLSLKEMIDGGIKKRGYFNYKVPVVKPIEFEEKNVLIDPYVLGCLIGDGYFGRRSITTGDTEMIKLITEKVESKIYDRTRGGNPIYEISLLKFKEQLNTYYDSDLKSDNKFIHNDYLYNSINVRFNLLKGLLDTDGTVDKRGLVSYSTKSKKLATDVVELVKSLGGFASIKEKKSSYKKENLVVDCGISYYVSISLTEEIGIPFNLSRKKERYKFRTKYSGNKLITDITFKGVEKTKCIFVEDESHEYITDDYIVTHNTTLLTKFANTAYNHGKNVLQIFFEDNAGQIKRKHYTIWTGVSPDEQPLFKDDVIGKVREVQESPNSGVLKLTKLPSDSVTISTIRNRIRKMISEGFNPDLIVIDYVDCISPERSTNGDEWKGEGSVMRSLESMTNEFNVAIWTATQGNRESISSEVVTGDQMGGSIKKAQIAHVILSIGKTLEQKEHKLATLTLVKSRIGQDGIIMSNCKFDNEYIIIDTDSQSTLLGFEEQKTQERANRAQEVYKKAQERNRRQQA